MTDRHFFLDDNGELIPDGTKIVVTTPHRSYETLFQKKYYTPARHPKGLLRDRAYYEVMEALPGKDLTKHIAQDWATDRRAHLTDTHMEGLEESGMVSQKRGLGVTKRDYAMRVWRTKPNAIAVDAREDTAYVYNPISNDGDCGRVILDMNADEQTLNAGIWLAMHNGKTGNLGDERSYGMALNRGVILKELSEHCAHLETSGSTVVMEGLFWI